MEQPKGFKPVIDTHFNIPLSKSLDANIAQFQKITKATADINLRPFQVGEVRTTLVTFENMVSDDQIARLLTLPLSRIQPKTATELFQLVQEGIFASGNVNLSGEFGKLFFLGASGFALLFIDGIDQAIAIGMQGYQFRGVSEPDSEANIRGSKEGFVEPLRVNMSMVRRRMKTPFLQMDILTLGSVAKNDLCMVYRRDKVKPELVNTVKKRLKGISLDNIQSSGYLRPFIEDDRPSLFSGVGTTERPDTLAAKISEGRIGILLDGTPFAMIVPYLFNEHFQSLDDYSGRSYYASLVRMMKYCSFFISILLPALFVAVVKFNVELLPTQFLNTIISSRAALPFSIGTEGILIFLIYELLKEAGLRMPKEVGHTVSFVGALVVGDAAVRAGLVSIPMLMVVALTAISSYIAPSLYEPVTFLRLIFIIIGSLWGIVGIFIGFTVVISDLCGLTVLGIPITTSFSPFSLYAMRDTLIRIGWKRLSKEQFNIDTF